MLISDIKRVVEQVGKDKGIEAEVLIKTLEEALASAARKILGRDADIETGYNDEAGEIEVFQFREVVENVENPVLGASILLNHVRTEVARQEEHRVAKVDHPPFAVSKRALVEDLVE